MTPGEQISEPIRRDTRSSSYSIVAITLHWLIAFVFAIQLGLGWRMSGGHGADSFALFQLHKSLGITILFLTLARLSWRLMVPPPPLSADMARRERLVAGTVHTLFYLLLLGLPLTGWLAVSSSARAIPTYLYGLMPWPHVPGIATLGVAAKASVNLVSDTSHSALAYVAYLAISLHVAGALKHHLIDQDDVIGRMLPVARRWRGFATALVIAGMMALALLAARGGLAPIAARLTHGAVEAKPLATALSAPAVTPPVGKAMVIAAPAAPAPAAVPTPGATDIASSEWVVRKAGSTLGFATKWSQGAVEGRFTRWDAKILFSADALTASNVVVTIDMASVTTRSEETQSALPGDDWFAVVTHPTATFTATRFDHQGGDRFVARGRLTLRGVSRALALPFILRIDDDVATMSASVQIDRRAFAVGQGEWAATDDLPADVTVTISLKADRKP